MVLILLFSVGLNELINPIENNIFREYDGTVKVTYEQGVMDMEIIKSGKQILIQLLIPRNIEKTSIKDFYSFILLPETPIEVKSGLKHGRRSAVIEAPIAYFDGKSFLGMNKRTFVSTALLGYRTSMLYVVGEFDNEGYKLIGESIAGHKVEFNRSSRLPIQIEIAEKKIVFNNWQRIEGFGFLPDNVDIWVNDNKVGERKLKSVTNPELSPAYFDVKKQEVPQVLE